MNNEGDLAVVLERRRRGAYRNSFIFVASSRVPVLTPSMSPDSQASVNIQLLSA